MPFEFKLPDIGEGVTEGEIVNWYVAPGGSISEDDPMVEIMTDKATVVIPSPVSGTVMDCRGAVGEVVAVGSILVVIDNGDGAAATPEAESEPSEPPTKAPEPAAPEPPPAPAAVAATPATASPAPTPSGAQTGRVLATPATRRIARERGLDLSQINGTGKQGRVTRADVLRTATQAGQQVDAPSMPAGPVSHGAAPDGAAPAAPVASAAPATPAPAPAPPVLGESIRTPIRGLRRRIADKMVESRRTAAHFSFVEEVDVTRLVELRARLNKRLVADDDSKISYLPFIIKALVAAVRRHPHINATVDEAAKEIIQHGNVHVGIAAATERGLMVPVIHGAEQRSLKELSSEIGRLADATRNGTARSEELSGSTITITSLGAQGGLFATPILNHPEVAICGVHRIKKRPWVGEDDNIEIRHIMLLSFSFDHRIIDGHVGAAFAYEMIRYLEDPDLLLMELV